MTIQIIRVSTQNDPDTGQPLSRSVTFTISDGTTTYLWGRGGLPLTGGVQALLNAEEPELWASASAGGTLATDYDISLAQARAWYVSNPGSKADVFDKTVDQLNADITSLVNTSFPSASAAIKTGWVRTLMSGLLVTRSFTFERNLV